MDNLPVEYTEWLAAVEEKAEDLIKIGPEAKRDKRSRAINAIISKVKMSALFYVSYLKDTESFAEEAVFQLAQFGLLGKELEKFQKAFKAYKFLKSGVSKEMSTALYKELKKKWRNDPLVKKQVLIIVQNMKKKFKCIRPVKVKVPRRRKDLFRDELLIQCALLFENKKHNGRNGKIGAFVNAVYAEEKYPSTKQGTDNVRKQISYVQKTAKGDTPEERINTLTQQWADVTDIKNINVGRKIALDKLSGKNL